ncbi:hypothetical protein ASG40_12685 [Methylobacterium sp. Leaf399]|uniref:hypothetical protein n=1 Tax=unclassified Methylobacterium TaxID=2615210 RepID=UPI0006FDC684|nr:MULTISPECIES: hypothetical protein [unclassified Methylobacterium]KQP50788.1 hypothetical protein ASF39_11065 [Methylobacterium sp. Leaf108]KQT07767.1 hypothetical protein ASG40_12685 [Methylobacterium sp. Leaf399]KQT82113.1 hypothetical protein ASG59_18830 [Methylobacterium sp. Leaf466]
MANTFRRVHAPAAAAVTLCLARKDGAVAAEVKLANGRQFSTTGLLPIAEAFGIAVHIANEGAMEMVVIDPQGLWKPSWGDLQG